MTLGLTAQAAVRSIAKVADAYKAAKVNGHKMSDKSRRILLTVLVQS
jgi:hypothetical protein